MFGKYSGLDRQEEEFESSDGDKRSSIAEAVWGPGFLGGTVGCSASLIFVFGHFWLAAEESCDWPRLISALAAWFAGALGGAMARDALMREDWARCRPLAGSILGLVIGCAGLVVDWDLWTGLAGSLGGALGAAIDAIVYRNTLEEDW